MADEVRIGISVACVSRSAESVRVPAKGGQIGAQLWADMGQVLHR